MAPFVQEAPSDGQAELLAAVDKALTAAMSSILHHPDFQAVEANWRTLDLLARRIETGMHLELVLYDVAVEEFTADLAAHEDLGESALYDMLVERPRQSEDQGPLAAVFGLYTFEEVPPHAELLARMSKICAHMDAPFVAAIGADYLKTKAEDLHPLVTKTWAAFRATPEAAYVGLAAPRFLLRMPYGKKTDPVDPFDYEEFNTREGMRSLLMGNPVALVAVLLAKTLAEQGSKISLGSIMSVDDMPFHYMTDRYGDQVALPSTERLLNQRMASDTTQRGYMPVLSIQGQNVVRLGSFNSLAGAELLGLWSGEEAKSLSAGKVAARTGVAMKSNMARPEKTAAAKPDQDSASDDDLGLGSDDDLDLGLDDMDLGLGDDLGLDLGGDDDFGSADDLDDLLSGLGDDDGGSDLDGMDDDLEALLADL
ncbi:MAG: type VI secretion system contractile sheath large subunit [Pseudomonadota bacterium]